MGVLRRILADEFGELRLEMQGNGKLSGLSVSGKRAVKNAKCYYIIEIVILDNVVII
ncbi:MAG: hypothetical protein ACLU00_04605 [Mediterraneibacter faecis]